MIKLELPIYYTQKFKTKDSKTFLVGLNWYRNAHHMLSNKVKEHYHQLVKEQVRDIKFKKVWISYHVFAGRNGTDGHNVRAVMEKFICDGLVSAGVIEDDSIEFLKGDESYYSIDKDNPRIVVFVEEFKTND